LVVFDSASTEGLQLHSQIPNLTISNGTLNTISLNAAFGLTVRSSAVMIGIFSKRGSQDLSNGTKLAS
jgi:hypothetical protein